MKNESVLARFLGVIAIVALLSAGCAPIPVNLPPAITPTSGVFLPGIEAGAGVASSPLQPTPIITNTVSTALAGEPSATIPVPTPVPTATVAPTLVGPAWEWVSSAFEDGTVLAPGDPTRYTVQLLGDGNALVQADCNFGTGTYEESDPDISFGSIGTTKMACPADSLGSAFLAQLRNAATFALDAEGAVITLKDSAGTMRLRAAPGETTTPAFAPLPSPTPLPTDTPWPPTPVPPSPATIPPTSPTPAPPATPTPLAPATLAPATLAPATPTTVVLPPTPVLVGTAVPLPTAGIAADVLPPLDATAWFLVSLTANNQAIPLVGTTPVTMEVSTDGGRISGSTGCNQYRATLVRDGDGVSIVGPALMTQKACAANLMVQEVEFIDSLLRTRGYRVLGDELTFLDAAGRAVLVFTRK